jgi:hypothetical protein
MKNLSITLITTILTINSSCKKDKFPKFDDLTGTWIEQTSNSIKTKLIFEDETMYLFNSSTIDTLSFQLDAKQELIILSQKNNPDAGESNHKILINKTRKTLIFWGLFAGINASKTVFEKK